MNALKRLLANARIRLALIIIVVAATISLFGYYLATHPSIIGLIVGLNPATLMLITLGYVGTVLANAFVLSISLRAIGKRVSFGENVGLTGYSSVVNFFGPLQSGPGFRAAYLKKRYNVSLRKFVTMTIVFYAFFAAFNGAIIAVALLISVPGNLAPLLAALGLFVAAAVCVAAYKFVPKVRTTIKAVRLSDPNIWLIGLGAAALSLCTAFAYYFELLHVDPTVNILQAIVYTAAANLALFVSLTPGAIGFRESFLLLTEQLHRIPDNVVIAASIIDRAFYVIFLLILFLVLILIGVKARLNSTETK